MVSFVCTRQKKMRVQQQKKNYFPKFHRMVSAFSEDKNPNLNPNPRVRVKGYGLRIGIRVRVSI